MSTLHPIRIAAKKAGLSPYLIRAWERRYNVVTPHRTDTNRRLYSDEDIERLSLLHKATLDGESIGQIANLSLSELASLVGGKNEYLSNEQSPASYVDMCLQAARDIDQKQLEAVLMKAAVNLSQRIFFEQVIEPLMYKTGDLWRSGEFKVLHEHVVSAVVRTILGGILNTQNAPKNASVMVVTTPAGQIHEFGALLAAVTAALDGWRVIYLGPNIPVDDIANAVDRQKAVVVALSIIYPPDDLTVTREFTKLRKFVGNDVRIIVGGRAAKYYQNVFDTIGAICVKSLEDLRVELDKIRNNFSA